MAVLVLVLVAVSSTWSSQSMLDHLLHLILKASLLIIVRLLHPQYSPTRNSRVGSGGRGCHCGFRNGAIAADTHLFGKSTPGLWLDKEANHSGGKVAAV